MLLLTNALTLLHVLAKIMLVQGNKIHPTLCGCNTAEGYVPGTANSCLYASGIVPLLSLCLNRAEFNGGGEGLWP